MTRNKGRPNMTRKKGRLNMTRKKQAGKESVKVGLRSEDELSRSKWSVGINQIVAGLRWIWPPSLVEYDRFQTLVSLSILFSSHMI